MSYFRGLGDPITSPSQVDDEPVVGMVTPKRVSCDELPPDSPWRQPGQVCAPTTGLLDFLTGLVDKVRAAAPTSDATPTPAPAPQDDNTGAPWLLLAAAGAAVYYFHKKRKRKA